MNDITANTIMGSGRQCFRDTSTAHRTRLRGRGERLVLDEPSTSTRSLVGQHVEEHTPTRISNMFSKIMVHEHTIYVKGFDSDETVFVHDSSAVLVQKIRSLISNLVVAPGNLMCGFPAVSRAPHLPTQIPMEFFEPALGFDEEAWIRNCFPVTQCGEILQANIDADFIVGVGVLSSSGFKLTGEDGEPLPCPVTLDSQRLEFTPRKSMQDKGDIPYLGDMKSFIGKQLESRLRVGDRLNLLLEAWKADLNSLPFLLLLDSAKKVFISFRESVSTILENLGVNLPEFHIRVFKLLDDCAQLSFRINRSAVSFIRLSASLKKQVVGFTAQIKLRKQPSSLFTGGIQSKFIAPQLHDKYLDSPHINAYRFVIAIHPTTEAVGFLAQICCKRTGSRIGGWWIRRLASGDTVQFVCPVHSYSWVAPSPVQNIFYTLKPHIWKAFAWDTEGSWWWMMP